MKIQIKRSNQLVDGEAKAPEEDMLDYGELAVNFNEADPAIFIKASDGAGSSSIVRLAGANVDPPPLPITFTAIITDTGADGNLVGKILTAEAQSISGGVNPVESAYRWYINGIPDSTSKTRTIQSSDIGGTLTCDITVSENGTGDNPVTQRATYAKTPAPAGSISTPTVLTPPDGAGIGGDITYTPKTSAITGVVDVPGGWNAVSAPEANSWWSVTYGLDKFVAVAGSGTNRVMYSTDGITWTSASAAEENFWYGVTYGDGKFVATAVNGSNQVMYSTDGINWTSASATEANNWISVTYGNGKFVAVSGTGTNLVMYSTDGINWNPAAAPEANNWYGVTYGDGKFVAVSGDGTNRVMYSTDAINWTSASAAEASNWYGVTYGDGKFVSVAYNGTNRIMYSADAVNWTPVAAPEANDWYSVTYGNGKFVAVAYTGTNRVMYSTDAINWTLASAAVDSEWYSVTYGAGKFVAVAGNGTNERIMWSETGTDSSTELTLTNSNTYNNADGSAMAAPISQTFLAGQTVSGVSATGTFGTDTPAFSTTLYTGTDAANNSITTGINNTDKSLIWIKSRDLAIDHYLFDSEHKGYALFSNLSAKLGTVNNGITAWNSNGFTLGKEGNVNGLRDYVAWNFRAAPGFLDIVTYTGDGVAGLTIPHSLGSTPGMMLVKNLDTSSDWAVYHQKVDLVAPEEYLLTLNRPNDRSQNSNIWNNTAPTETKFTTGIATATNKGGDRHIAYLFADTPGKIKCDFYNGNGGSQTIECGFEPQWVMIKAYSNNSLQPIADTRFTNWIIADNKRPTDASLAANLNQPEKGTDIPDEQVEFTSSGFTLPVGRTSVNGNFKYVYIAIAKDVVAGEFGPTGTLTADADNNGPTITLSDVTGTWTAGMEVVNDTEITEFAPGADDLAFTSSVPSGTNITTYGQATWQVDTDVNFSSPMTATKTIAPANSIQFLLPSERGAITLDEDTTYNIRLKYDAANPSGIQSAYSDVNQFKTAAAASVQTWNVASTSSDNYFVASAYGNNTVVIVGNSPIVEYSADNGETWAASTGDMIGSQAVAFGNGVFIAGGRSFFMRSADNGRTWSKIASDSAEPWSAITYGNGMFVACRNSTQLMNKTAYSVDGGYTWNYGTNSRVPYASITYGNGYFCAFSADPFADESTAQVLYSSDGINFTGVTGLTNSFYYSAAYGNGRFVAIDNVSGFSLTSTDGINWTSLTNSTTITSVSSMTYGGGKFLAARGTGKNQISQSTDGLTWTEGAVPTSDFYYETVTYAGDRFVVVAGSPGPPNNVLWSYTGDSDPATFMAFDANNNKPLNDLDITARYGVDPTADNTSLGIYELTEQPTGAVAAYVPDGDKYKPVIDLSQPLEQAQAEAAQANARLDEANITIETMRSNFETRIAALESES